MKPPPQRGGDGDRRFVIYIFFWLFGSKDFGKKEPGILFYSFA
jgi:hypothetical protein